MLMHRLLIFFSCLIYSLPAISQHDKIDSLMHEYDSAKSESQKVAILSELVECESNDSTHAVFLKEATALIEKSDDAELSARLDIANTKHYMNAGNDSEAYAVIGKALRKTDDLRNPEIIVSIYDLAIRLSRYTGRYDTCLLLSKHIFENPDFNQYSEQQGQIHFHVGVVHDIRGEYKQALDHFIESHRYFTEAGSEYYQAMLLNSIGIVNKNIGNYDKAINYYKQSLVIFKKLEKNKMLGNVYDNMAACLIKLKSYPEAFNYIDSGLVIRTRINDLAGIATSNLNKGAIYYDLKQYQEAFRFDSIGLTYSKKANTKYRTAQILRSLGWIANEQSKYDVANQYAEEALQMSRELKYQEAEMKIYRLLASIKENQGKKQQALDYFKQYIELKDTLLNIANNNQINKYQVLYETEQKEKEILQNELDIAKVSKERNRYIYLALIIAGLGLGLLFFFQSKIKKDKIIADQNNQIQNQKILDLENENKILTLNAMIVGQEEERKRIAQDLHDGLGGLLATVRTRFKVIQDEIEKLEQMNVYSSAVDMLDNACDEVRKISHNLMPDALNLLGLLPAISDLVSETNMSGKINMEFTSDKASEVLELSDTQKIMIFRAIQELLNNTIKHADAQRINLDFFIDNKGLNITFEDDGKGFDMNQIENGLGLGSVNSRIAFLKGTTDWQSSPCDGTFVKMQIPLEHA